MIDYKPFSTPPEKLENVPKMGRYATVMAIPSISRLTNVMIFPQSAKSRQGLPRFVFAGLLDYLCEKR